MKLRSYTQGEWVEGAGNGTPLVHAVTGETIAEATNSVAGRRPTPAKASRLRCPQNAGILRDSLA